MIQTLYVHIREPDKRWLSAKKRNRHKIPNPLKPKNMARMQ